VTTNRLPSEQVADQPRQVRHLSLHDGLHPGQLPCRKPTQQSRCRADRHQGAAQLVRQHGHELGLLAMSLLGGGLKVLLGEHSLDELLVRLLQLRAPAADRELIMDGLR
jgi:hypothetical protein